MNHRLFVITVAVAIGGLSSSAADGPFSIVSMTLDDKALAGAHDVELSGNIAYVPGKEQSLSVIDITDPAKPEILWFKYDDEIRDSETVLPVGDHLLLGTTDFLTLDVKDPKNPVILKTISDPPRIDRINGIVKIGAYALAANKSGYIDAFEISDLANPEYFGALETKKAFGLMSPHDIDRYGDHVVIVDPRGFVPPLGGLGVFKVAEGGKVLSLDQWTLSGKVEARALIGANRVQMHGDFAIVAGSFMSEVRKEIEAGKGSVARAHMAVVDLSDPGEPKVVAKLLFPDERGPNGLTLAGKVAFCAGGQTVAAYDISDPKNPQLLVSQSFPKYKKDAKKSDNYHDLIYRDGYLYVSAQCDNGFLILKLDDERIRELAGLGSGPGSG